MKLSDLEQTLLILRTERGWYDTPHAKDETTLRHIDETITALHHLVIHLETTGRKK
jgi:hypothetical protein